MNIEFHSPVGAVKEWLISYAKEQLLDLYHRNRNMSRAHVAFKSDGGMGYKVCEIEVTINGYLLFIHSQGNSYGMAMRNAMAGLTQKINEHNLHFEC